MKKQNVVDTAISLALGGGANVVVDYATSSIDALASVDEKWINAGKLVIGAVGSAFFGNKMAKDALNGIAVVGASNLIKGLMNQTPAVDNGGASGVPYGTVGRLNRRRLPNRRLTSTIRNTMNGVPASTFVQ